MNDQETATLKVLVDKFEAAHPDIKVDMCYVTFDQRPEVHHGGPGGPGPDMMRADTAPDVAGWAARASSPT